MINNTQKVAAHTCKYKEIGDCWVTIKLNTVKDVYDFVNICTKYHDKSVDVKQGRQIIDGKSILGIYSLNLLNPMDVEISSENYDSQIDFYDSITIWKAV